MARPLFDRWPRLGRWMFRSARSVSCSLPPEYLHVLSLTFGSLAWLIDVRGRKKVHRNLSHFIPASCPHALSRSVRRNYTDFFRYVFASLRMDQMTEDEIDPKHITVIDPWSVFRHPPLSGPAIIAVAHCNWELAGAIIRRKGFVADLEAVMLSSGNTDIDALYERIRSGVPGRTIWLGREPLAALRALKAGRILAVAVDRDYHHTGLRMPFAGETMSVPRGPAALAVQTGAPIIPIFLARSGPSTWNLIVAKPLRPHAHQTKNVQVDTMTRALAHIMQRFIATAPSQWVAFHDAWQPMNTPESSIKPS